MCESFKFYLKKNQLTRSNRKSINNAAFFKTTRASKFISYFTFYLWFFVRIPLKNKKGVDISYKNIFNSIWPTASIRFLYFQTVIYKKATLDFRKVCIILLMISNFFFLNHKSYFWKRVLTRKCYIYWLSAHKIW